MNFDNFNTSVDECRAKEPISDMQIFIHWI